MAFIIYVLYSTFKRMLHREGYFIISYGISIVGLLLLLLGGTPCTLNNINYLGVLIYVNLLSVSVSKHWSSNLFTKNRNISCDSVRLFDFVDKFVQTFFIFNSLFRYDNKGDRKIVLLKPLVLILGPKKKLASLEDSHNYTYNWRNIHYVFMENSTYLYVYVLVY